MSFDIAGIAADLPEMKQDNSPSWPVYAFLVAEVRRLRGEDAEARQIYRDIVTWAVADPYEDGMGGTGLASLALCRWLESIRNESTPGREEIERVADISEKLRYTKLARRMSSQPVLSALPQLQEEVSRQLAMLALSSGIDRAPRLFLDYMTVARTADLDRTEEQQMMRELQERRLASPDQLNLVRGKRQQWLGHYDEAKTTLERVRRSRDPRVRSEAGLVLYEVKRIRGENPGDLLSSVIEETTSPEVADEARFKRGGVEDLKALAESVPPGPHASEALYELGRHYQYAGDVNNALGCFEQVRSFQGPNNRRLLATFVAALIHYTRRQPGDIEKAKALLKELSDPEPPGELRPLALFWLGRIAEESGDREGSKSYFERVIAEAPYDYYAVRSRMHIAIGSRASREFGPDPATASQLRSAYRAATLDTSVSRKTPYHTRLDDALSSGLYAAAAKAGLEVSAVVESSRRKEKNFSSLRLEDLSLGELDSSGLLAPVALLLALRQDAVAAKDAFPDIENRLQIAGAIEQRAGDWPMATSLMIASGEPYQQRWAMQRDKRFLATAYPVVYEGLFRKASSDWRQVQPELLYSVAREESSFHPGALSAKGAIGLFQFMRSTFEERDSEWHLLRESGAKTRESFLLNVELSVHLAGRWFDHLLKKRERSDVNTRIPFALMEHNAGEPKVNEWISYWKRLERADDIEYMVDTIRILATRNFMRRVLNDAWIVGSAEVLDSE